MLKLLQWRWFPLALAIVVVVVLRLPSLPVTTWNMDEGFTATTASTVLDGGVVYRDAVDHRAPLTNFAYAAVFAAAGKYNMVAIKLALMALVCVLTVLVYLLAERIVGRRGAVFAVLVFALETTLAFGPDHTYAFHTEWCLALFSTLGACLFVRGLLGRQHWLLSLTSGACFGLAFFSKQPAAFDFLAVFVLLALAVVGYRGIASGKGRWWPPREGALLAGGFFIVSLAFVGYFYLAGAWDDFVFYFLTYNSEYYIAAIAPHERIARGFALSLRALDPLNLGIFVLLGALAALAWRSDRKGDGEAGRHAARLYLVIWAFCSWAATLLSGREFGHYLIQVLPSWCVLSGLGFEALCRAVAAAPQSATATPGRRAWYVATLVAAVGVCGLTRPANNVRKIHYVRQRRDPALEQLVDYIQTNSQQSDTIFVWGFYPEIYVHCRRDPASRYSYCTFVTGLIPWVNIAYNVGTTEWVVPGSMEILLDELRNNRPQFVVDTTPGNHCYFGKYPIENFAGLHRLIASEYVLDRRIEDARGKVLFNLYRRSCDTEPTVAAQQPPAVQALSALEPRQTKNR